MAEDVMADYIIVGAGSAGCVLANRLSADGKTRVLLLEAGGDDRPTRELGQFMSNVMIHVPVGYSQTLKDPKVNWLYATEPDPGTGGRVHVWPRGKVLGGSSSINGLIYIRGQHADYDGWRQLGCEGWGWDDVKPYFLRAEHQERGASEHHAVGGPLNVSDVTERHLISDAVVEACVEAGLPRNADVNGADQEGVTYYQLTVRGGRRCSAAVAYLHPALGRSNLRVETRALTTRVLFDGKAAVGVEYRQGGALKVAKASREVILCGGAVNSPQLLQLSGVGPAALLSEHGVPVVVDARGVGENLQDHYVMLASWRLKAGVISVNELTRGPRFIGETLKYRVSAQGPSDVVGRPHRGVLQVASRSGRSRHPVPCASGHPGHAKGHDRGQDGIGGQTGPDHRALSACDRKAAATSASARRTGPSIPPSRPTISPIPWIRKSLSRR